MQIIAKRDAALTELQTRSASAETALDGATALLKGNQDAYHADLVAWGQTEETAFAEWDFNIR